jgi:predicted metal-dependent hydrolase
VHEMIHLIEPTHNQNFVTLMTHHMPQWKSHRETLNWLPVKHEEWKY